MSRRGRPRVAERSDKLDLEVVGAMRHVFDHDCRNEDSGWYRNDRCPHLTKRERLVLDAYFAHVMRRMFVRHRRTPIPAFHRLGYWAHEEFESA